MKKWEFIIGVDVSKLTLDLYFNEGKSHLKIENSTVGFRQLLKWCKTLNINLSEAIFSMEITGGYEYKLVQFLTAKNIAFIRIPALAIKRSLGITRGKNDRVDALRIAKYTEEKQKSLNASNPLNMNILTLKELLRFRKRIVREMAGYKASIKERKHIYPEKRKDLICEIMQKKIVENSKKLKLIESEIERIIISEEALHVNFKLITSIKGIGNVNAWMLIAYTENFNSFKDARSFAVYTGVIPFDNSSGTSLNGRKRVSNLANKELKQELSQAAKSAIQWDTELKLYAERKLQNKPYGIVINNVKFKLILRVFSIIKKQHPFVDKYKKAA
jgi:transposase